MYSSRPSVIAARCAIVALSASTLLANASAASASSSRSSYRAPSFVTSANASGDDRTDLTFNQLLGIDDNGIIAGYYGNGAAGHPNKRYTVAPPYSSFHPDNLPTFTQTQATGITTSPMGTTTGFWSPTNLGTNDANFGFIRYVASGVTLFIDVNDPKSTSSPAVNQVLGINSALNAVGFYNDAKGNSHGYIYSVHSGTFVEPFVDSLAVSNALTGINQSNNLICGFFLDIKNHTKGFVQSLINSKSIHIEAPNSTFTQFLGVNNAGEAVGFYNDAAGVPHGVLFNSSTNALTVINAPLDAQGTVLNGINNKHQVVAFYTDKNGHTNGMLINNVP